MFDKIVFFEYRHYGDLHITRNFVKYVIDNVKSKEYEYILKRNPRVFLDVKQLTFKNIFDHDYQLKGYDDWKVVDNIFFINTSLGTDNLKYYKGCNIQTGYNIFKTLMKEKINYVINEKIDYFIPSINFSDFYIKDVDNFMSKYVGKKKVLIVNGETQSGQALNFDFNPIIDVVSDKFKDVMFFLTDYPKVFDKSNVFYCKDIIGLREECDIVETTYFSLFCDTIVGRSSGVYTMSFIKENMGDINKTFICISHKDIYSGRSDFGFSELFPGLSKRIIFSDNFDIYNIINIISKKM